MRWTSLYLAKLLTRYPVHWFKHVSFRIRGTVRSCLILSRGSILQRAFVMRGVRRWSVDSTHKGPVTRKKHLMMLSWWLMLSFWYLKFQSNYTFPHITTAKLLYHVPTCDYSSQLKSNTSVYNMWIIGLWNWSQAAFLRLRSKANKTCLYRFQLGWLLLICG